MNHLNGQSNIQIPSEFVRSKEGEAVTQEQYYNSHIDPHLIDGESMKINTFADNRLLIDSETPISLTKPHFQLASLPGHSELSTIQNELSSNNEVVISQMLNKESILR